MGRKSLSRQKSTTALSADSSTHENAAVNRVSLSFADIENTLNKFAGDGTTNINIWFTDLERAATAFNWDYMQKFIFCKRLLTDVAKLFIDFEIRPVTYDELKEELIKEFGHKDCSADVHKKLKQRKMRNGEGLLEYLYCMIGIGSQINMDDASIISYVIDGIRDAASNKAMLFGANSIREFKEKLNNYKKFKESTAQHSSEYNNDIKTVKSKHNNNKRCYNCGSFEHEFHSCPRKANGPKCFKCNKFGHKAADCSE